MQAEELDKLAKQIQLESEDSFRLRISFAIACVERVQHLLIDQDILQALETGKRYCAEEADSKQLAEAASRAAEFARSQKGTNSLDGSGSAAVSSSHGVAAALAGRALDAAGYAAYAKVYSYASHAVTDASAYADEHRWQLAKLQELASLG